MIGEWPNAAGEMAQRIRAHDWAATPLGPIDTWPQALRTTVGVLLTLNEPVALAWGPEFIVLYNDAYVDLYGDKNEAPPLGLAVADARPEIWSTIGPEYEQVLRGGPAVRHENRLVPVRRHGRTEDIRWTYSFNPVPDADAPHGVGGVLIVAVRSAETAGAMRASDERQLFLSRLSDALRPLSDPQAVRAQACRMLGEQLEADWVVYGLIDLARHTVDIDRGYAPNGQPPITGEQSLSAFEWTLPFYKAGTTVVISDTRTSDRVPVAERPALAEMKMTALISVPLLKNGDLVGALAVSREQPTVWTDAQIRLAEETAERIWEAIERARVGSELQLSEARLKTIFDTLPVGIGFMDQEGKLIVQNEAMRRYMPTGNLPSNDETQRSRWAIYYPDGSVAAPNDWPGARASRGEPVTPGLEGRYTPADGPPIWTQIASVPCLDSTGRQTGYLSVVTDIDALKRAVEHKSLLLAELQHRVRNTIAMVRAIVRRTINTAETMAGAAASLEGRIGALARTQVLLTRNAGSGIDLELLIRDELHAQITDESRASISGPSVTLAPKAAEVLTLAIHELATNALKHGASDHDGFLTIHWAVEPDQHGTPHLHLDWMEAGGGMVAPVAGRPGFGTELIERRVPYELGGRASLELRPGGGVHAEIVFPLVPGASILSTDAPSGLKP